MRRRWIMLFVLVMVFGLSSCSSRRVRLEYNKMDTTVAEYEVYHITVKQSSNGYCEGFHTVDLSVDETTNVMFVYGCMGDGYFVKVEETYLQFDHAVAAGYITVQDILKAGFGRVYNTMSVMQRLDLQFDDYVITKVQVQELQGELFTSGSGEWDTRYDLDVSLSDIQEYIIPLFAVQLDTSSICETESCVKYKGQASIQIELKSLTSTIDIQVYETYLDVWYTNGEEDSIYIYTVRDTEDTANALFEYLKLRHIIINK